MAKTKTTNDDESWELETSPIWHIVGREIVPSPVCLKWWQALAEKKTGSKEDWLDVACQLGYVAKSVSVKSGSISYEPRVFEYDGLLVRRSLGLSESDPLVFKDTPACNRLYQRLWDRLLKERDDEERSDLG